MGTPRHRAPGAKRSSRQSPATAVVPLNNECTIHSLNCTRPPPSFSYAQKILHWEMSSVAASVYFTTAFVLPLSPPRCYLRPAHLHTAADAAGVETRLVAAEAGLLRHQNCAKKHQEKMCTAWTNPRQMPGLRGKRCVRGRYRAVHARGTLDKDGCPAAKGPVRALRTREASSAPAQKMQVGTRREMQTAHLRPGQREWQHCWQRIRSQKAEREQGSWVQCSDRPCRSGGKVQHAVYRND